MDVLSAIGNTSLVRLRRVVPEGCAEADGRLRPGDAAVEYTGGSTGTSSGANVVAALREARRLGPGRTVVTLMADSGLKYASTDVFRSPAA